MKKKKKISTRPLRYPPMRKILNCGCRLEWDPTTPITASKRTITMMTMIFLTKQKSLYEIQIRFIPDHPQEVKQTSKIVVQGSRRISFGHAALVTGNDINLKY